MISVLLVDDVPLLRAGLAALLERTAGFALGGEAVTAAEALDCARRSAPAAAIVNLAIECGTGLDLIRRLHTEWPALGLIALCLHDDPLLGERALRAGARGVLGRQTDGGQVALALERVLAGRLYMSDALGERLLARLAGAGAVTRDGVAGMTDRELEVFSLYGHGLSTVEIAGRLHLSVKTIECYRERIKRKLGVSGSPALIRQAVQWSLGAG